MCRFESAPINGGETFTKAHPDWQENTWAQFGEYIQKEFCDEEEDDEDDSDGSDNNLGESSKRSLNPKSTILELDMDDDNWPILPIHTNQSLATRKDIIRQYVMMSYRKHAIP
jgi:hypothetical protein